MTSARTTRRRGPDARAVRSSLVAIASCFVVFGGLGWIVVNAPGWPEVQTSFFNREVFEKTLPSLVDAFVINIQLFVVAEVLVLVFGLVLAVMRSLHGPAFLPLRVLSNVYTDVFRAVPGIVVIFLLGFGIPGLGIIDPRTDQRLFGILALALVYSAYVAEVYRAGINSIHPSQDAAARSLGLSRLQSLRHVVIPQAIRRVIPPLLNDFIGLQKDTVLVSFIGVVEIFRLSQIESAATYNFTPYIAVALCVHRHHRAAHPRRRLADRPQRDRGVERGRAVTEALRIEGLHKSFGSLEGPPGHRPRRRRARGRLPHRCVGAPASRRSCAASTCSSGSTPGGSSSVATRSRPITSRSTGSGAGSGSSSRHSTCSRTCRSSTT
jgi:polar amino acid transport system permease protein